MALTIAPPIESVLARFDQSEPLDEGALAQALAQAQRELGTATKEIQHGAFAELAAWHFTRADEGTGDPWGLYWTPMSSGVLTDNTPFYSPDVAHVDDLILTHWIERADRAHHPLMVARYSDLAWEVGRYLAVPPAKRPVCSAPQATVTVGADLPRRAIDAYIEAVANQGIKDEYTAWVCLSRASMLAVLLNDTARVAIVKRSLFAYFTAREQVRGEKGHMMWWRLHDIVERSETALDLSQVDRNFVTASLKQALDEHADPDSPRFDPHQAQNAANRLLKWERMQLTQQQQIVLQAGKAFEHAAGLATAMLANGWLEDLIPFYRKYHLVADVARVEQLIRSRADEAKEAMVKMRVPYNITAEQMAVWADQLAGNSRDEGLRQLAGHGLLNPDKLAVTVQELKELAPLTALIPVSVMGADGFTDATIGTVDNDLEGRTYQMAANQMGLDAGFIHAAFQRIREKHGLNAEDLLVVIMASPFVAPEQEPLIRAGLDAWIAGDAIKAVHILVPQVEAAYRRLLSATGMSIRRPNPKVSGSKVIGFGEVLNQDVFKTGTLKSLGFHLRALYTDPRGLNLRNKLAHGLAHGPSLTMGTANGVVHSLLLLTLVIQQPRTSLRDEAR